MLQISDLTDIQPGNHVEEALIQLQISDELEADARDLLGRAKSGNDLKHCLEQFTDAAELRKHGLLRLTAFAFNGSNGLGVKDGSD